MQIRFDEISTKFELNISNLEKIVESGLPDKVKKDIGNALIARQWRRIKYESETYDGEKLDDNAPFYADAKFEETGSDRPLVLTGAMTEPDAFEISSTIDGLSIELTPEHFEKWDNIVDIAETQGKNWNKAFGGFNEQDIVNIISTINLYFARELNLQVFDRPDFELV